MKKLILATVLALAGADVSLASQFTKPSFDGQYFCKFTNAGGYFNVRFSSTVVENPRTCKNGVCSTNGYKQVTRASIYLNLWDKPHDADRVVINNSRNVTFFKSFDKAFLHVSLTKSFATGKLFGTYTDTKGTRYNLVCTR